MRVPLRHESNDSSTPCWLGLVTPRRRRRSDRICNPSKRRQFARARVGGPALRDVPFDDGPKDDVAWVLTRGNLERDKATIASACGDGCRMQRWFPTRVAWKHAFGVGQL